MEIRLKKKINYIFKLPILMMLSFIICLLILLIFPASTSSLHCLKMFGFNNLYLFIIYIELTVLSVLNLIFL